MGKTSLVLTTAQNAAIGRKAVVAFFSLEMSKEELGFRFLSGLSRIDSKRLKIGRLADRDWSRLAQAADLLSKCSTACGLPICRRLRVCSIPPS